MLSLGAIIGKSNGHLARLYISFDKRVAYPDPKGCLMIIGGPAAHKSKRRQKLTDREVNEATLGVLAFLK
jgi:hypothetical protein